jgi:membrane protease YdiL (CAAX protease family)
MPDFHIERSWIGRGLAVGRCVLFLLISVLLAICIGRIFKRPLSHIHGAFFAVMTGNALGSVILLLSAAAMVKFQWRKMGQFGLGGQHQARAVVLGIFSGAAVISLLLLTLAVCGAFSFGGRAEFGVDAIRFAALNLFYFVALAVCEETMYRGYLLVNLSKAVGFWPALLTLSALFAMAHLHNTGENRRGLFEVFAFGVLMGYSFRWSGSLWFAIGLHASWDYCLSFIFGVADSGMFYPGKLMNPITTGPTWLTGGEAGPEASPLMVGVFVIVFLIIRFALAQQKGQHRAVPTIAATCTQHGT